MRTRLLIAFLPALIAAAHSKTPASPPLPADLATRVDTIWCVEPGQTSGRNLPAGFGQIGDGQWLPTNSWALGPCLSGFAFRDTAGHAEPSILLIPTETADGIVRTKIFMSWGARWAGVAFRVRGPDDYMAVLMSPRDHYVRLVSVNRGRTQRVASWKGSFDSSAAHELTVTFRGPDIEVWLDSNRVIHSRTGGYSGSGRVGLAARTAATGIPRFDWVQIGR